MSEEVENQLKCAHGEGKHCGSDMSRTDCEVAYGSSNLTFAQHG